MATTRILEPGIDKKFDLIYAEAEDLDARAFAHFQAIMYVGV